MRIIAVIAAGVAAIATSLGLVALISKRRTQGKTLGPAIYY